VSCQHLRRVGQRRPCSILREEALQPDRRDDSLAIPDVAHGNVELQEVVAWDRLSGGAQRVEEEDEIVQLELILSDEDQAGWPRQGKPQGRRGEHENGHREDHRRDLLARSDAVADRNDARRQDPHD